MNFVDGNTTPQLNSVKSGNDVVWKDSDGLFNLTLKSVRDNDYFDGGASEEAWQVLELTNAEREKENLPALTLSEGLTEGASIRAQEITAKGKLGILKDHTRLDNKTGYATVLEGKYNYSGENLDGGAVSPAQVVQEWMDSESHKENILRENFRKVGIGYNEDDPDPTDHRYYWTQLFADSLKAQETVSATRLLTANIATDAVSKLIACNDEANTLKNSDYGVTVQTGAGNDSITNEGLNVSLSADAGNDTIKNSGSFSTINASTGDDLIDLASDTKEILIEYVAGDGSDTISGFNATDTISLSKDIVFTPEIVGNDIVLTIGDDSITLLDNANLASDLSFIDGYWSGVIVISDDNYNHNFSNSIDGIAGVSIQALGGNNTITNGYYGDYVSIECGNGNDSILNNGDLVTITSGSGRDKIQNYAGDGASINTGEGNDSVDNALAVQVTIDTGAGDDNIENNFLSNRASINSGIGNDSIGNYAVDSSIDAGIGNDTIVNLQGGTGSSIQGDKGNDNIYNFAETVIIEGGTGNDIITNFEDGNAVTINAGDDNDNVDNVASQVSISGGEDNDTISSSGSDVTITGGAGNDRIELSYDAQNNLIQYNEGDGKDEVWGFNETDKLIIGDGTGTYYPETINGHLFINVGTGYVAFGNGANLSATDIVEGVVGEAKEDTKLIYLSDYEYDEDEIFVDVFYNLDNVIIELDEPPFLYLGVYNSGSNVSMIPSDPYLFFIDNSGDNVYIFGETEAVTGKVISNTGFNVTIKGSDENDHISNTGDNVEITGNKGNDIISNTGNNVKIDDMIYFGSDTINNSGNNVLILGSFAKDSIVNSGDNVYILGGDDDDVIELSNDAQNNIIAYSQGDGHDTVKGFSQTDTLLMYVVSSYSKETVGNDIIIDVNNGYGSVTLEDAASLESPKIIVTRLNGNTITRYDSGNSVTFEGAGIVEGNRIILGSGDDNYFNEQADMVIQAFAGNDTIMNVGDNVTVDLGAGKDHLTSSGTGVSINGGAGADTLLSVGVYDVTIIGGSGDDSIGNSSDNVSISGGADNDTVENYGSNSTIDSGEGNDSIENSADNSSIDLGEGDDILWNNGDSITINSASGNNDIYNLGDSASIITGNGDDTLWNGGDNYATINTGAGYDSVFNSCANTSIELGVGNDFLHNRGDNSRIDLGDGDDTVRIDASDLTITGGGGNDRITLESDAKNNLIQYNVGDGDDTIWGLNENSSLQIGDGKGTYYSTVQGDDVILTVAEGSITLKDFRNKPKHIIIGESGTSGGNSDGNGDGGNNSSGEGKGGNGSGNKGDTSGGKSTDEGKNSDASGGKSATGSKGSDTSSDNGNNTQQENLIIPPINPQPSNPGEQPADTNPNPSPQPSTSNQHVDTSNQSANTAPVPSIVANQNAAAINNTLQYDNQSSENKITLTSLPNLTFPTATEVLSAAQNLNSFVNGSIDSDELYAVDEGSQLWGGDDFSSDTLIGGSGNDIFIGGKNQGSDLFLNVSSSDIVYLGDVTFNDLSAVKKDNDMIYISFKTGNTITIQSSEIDSGAIVFADSTWRFKHST